MPLFDLRKDIKSIKQSIGKPFDGIQSGIKALDNFILGFGKGEMSTIAGRPGMGKQNPIDTPVLTPMGWVELGKLKVGEYVIGMDGYPTQILNIFPQGIQQAYKVVFRDGSNVECGIEHLWGVYSDGGNGRNKLKIKSLQELLNLGITRYKGNNRRGAKWRIPVCKPIVTNKQDLFIHPYILGILIGDGCLVNKALRFSNPDFDGDISCLVSKLLPKNCKLIKYTKGQSCPCYSIRGDGWKLVREYIKNLKLNVKSLNKFIPNIYLQGSINQRLWLLRGLMDTDGSCINNKSSFYTTSKILADQVVNLIRSLGGISWVRKYNRTKENKPTEYVVIVNMLQSPFFCNRKKRQWKPTKKLSRYIWEIKPTRMVEQACIKVASADGLFIIKDFIVTHNSSMSRDILLNVGKPSVKMGASLLCTLEMSCEEVIELLAANLAKVDYQDIKRGYATKKALTKFQTAIEQLSQYNIIINDDSYVVPDSIREILKSIEKEEPIACLIIDYLQLMSLRKYTTNRQEEVSEISRELKAIAREFDIPVIAFSQLNRNVEFRESSRPRMIDLRESGAMENDSTKIILIHRPSYYDKQLDPNAEDSGEAELIICKNRGGATGNIGCAFISNYMSFQDLPEEEF